MLRITKAHIARYKAEASKTIADEISALLDSINVTGYKVDCSTETPGLIMVFIDPAELLARGIEDRENDQT